MIYSNALNDILNQITHDKAGKTKFFTSALICEHMRAANETCAGNMKSQFTKLHYISTHLALQKLK